MEQKDYLLREIEKIGSVLQALLAKITGSKGNSAITIEHQFPEIKELLLNETGFNLDRILTCRKIDIEPYVREFEGLNVSNIEVLADIIYELGMKFNPSPSKKYLRSAMHLYELCVKMDKTYSSVREAKIVDICRWL